VFWRPGDGGEEVVVEALNVGGSWEWREEMKSGERCSGGRQGLSLYIGVEAEGCG
jgi:hypothetical protein